MKLAICAALLFLFGCATVFSGRYQEVSVTSVPIGAKACADVDLNLCVKTPGVLSLKRGEDHLVQIEMEGYLPETVKITREPNSVSGLNAVAPFPVNLGMMALGGGIDAASGAIFRLSPEEIHVNLIKEPPGIPIYE